MSDEGKDKGVQGTPGTEKARRPATVGDLLKLGLTKYKIAQLAGVAWETVKAWDRKWYAPNEEHQKGLDAIRTIVETHGLAGLKEAIRQAKEAEAA